LHLQNYKNSHYKKIMSSTHKTINNLFNQLFPILRSITGAGYIKSLNILSKYIKFKKLRYPSGKKVFDWTVPKEWIIKDAYVKVDGKKIIDFKKNNLHIVNYSAPVNKTMPLKELNRHLYSLKKRPNIIPYVTSYYKKNFGFCVEHQKRKKLKDKNYQVVIDSKFINGNVVNGISEIKGKTKKTILISSYLCHPSMANNELSGPLTMVGLYDKIKKWKNRQFNYLFLINPETIGSVCFLSNYKEFIIVNLAGENHPPSYIHTLPFSSIAKVPVTNSTSVTFFIIKCLILHAVSASILFKLILYKGSVSL